MQENDERKRAAKGRKIASFTIATQRQHLFFDIHQRKKKKIRWKTKQRKEEEDEKKKLWLSWEIILPSFPYWNSFAKMKHTNWNTCWQELEQTNFVHVERWLCYKPNICFQWKRRNLLVLRFLRQSKEFVVCITFLYNFLSSFLSIPLTLTVFSHSHSFVNVLVFMCYATLYHAVSIEYCQKKVCSNVFPKNFTYSFYQYEMKR